MNLSGRWFRLFVAVTALLMVTSVLLVFLVAPDAANLATNTERAVQRIFYFHVPSWWVGFLAFLVAAVAGGGYLASGQETWDMIELSSIEIGLTFTTIGLISGSIWAKPTWNTWWTWEPRLTTAAVGWLLYVGYLFLRNGVENPRRRARLAAVLSIVAFVSVPVNFMAIRWWRTIHPVVIGTASEGAVGGFAAGPSMRLVFFFCLFSFTCLYAVLLVMRFRSEHMARRLQQLKQMVTLW